MKVTKFVDVEAEVEVDVTFADLVSEMTPNVENTRAMLAGFSVFLNFTKSLPNELLSTLNEKQREIIVTALSEQLARIASASVQPTPVTVPA